MDGESAPLPLRVQAMLALCAQQSRLLERALAEEHRRQRVELEGWLAADETGASGAIAEAGLGQPAVSEPVGAGPCGGAEADAGQGGEEAAVGPEGYKRARTEACRGGARVAALVARFGGGRPIEAAEASGDAAAGGPQSGVQAVEAGYGAATGAVCTHPDDNNEDVQSGAPGLERDDAHPMNVYVQEAASGGSQHEHNGDSAPWPIVDEEAESFAVSAELQAAEAAGGAADDADAEDRHPEESDELRAAMTAGGAPDGPIATVEVPQPTLAEIGRTAGDEHSQGWQLAGRRRRGGVRAPLPTPPPSRSSAYEQFAGAANAAVAAVVTDAVIAEQVVAGAVAVADEQNSAGATRADGHLEARVHRAAGRTREPLPQPPPSCSRGSAAVQSSQSSDGGTADSRGWDELSSASSARRRRRRRPRQSSRDRPVRRAEEELEVISEEWREVVALARRAGVQLVFGDEGDEI